MQSWSAAIPHLNQEAIDVLTMICRRNRDLYSIIIQVANKCLGFLLEAQVKKLKGFFSINFFRDFDLRHILPPSTIPTLDEYTRAEKKEIF